MSDKLCTRDKFRCRFSEKNFENFDTLFAEFFREWITKANNNWTLPFFDYRIGNHFVRSDVYILAQFYHRRDDHQESVFVNIVILLDNMQYGVDWSHARVRLNCQNEVFGNQANAINTSIFAFFLE